MSEDGQNGSELPSAKAGVSPTSGVAPPAEHRFKPGHPGGPGRPKNAGMSLIEYVNSLFAEDPTEDDLRAIVRATWLPIRKRAAANLLLNLVERPNLKEFAQLLDGSSTIDKYGDYWTEQIKKIKQTKYGVEIELHDRSGAAVDRVCDRTHGKPSLQVNVTNDDSLRDPADGAAAAADINRRLMDALGAAGADGPGNGS